MDAQKILVLKYPKAKTWADCLFAVTHSKAEHIPFFNQHLEDTFTQIKQQTDPQELQNLFYKIDYLMSAQTRYFRGSSAIKEWAVSALYRHKGYAEHKRVYGETDQYAQVLTFDVFAQKLLAKDGPLNPIVQ